MSVFEYIMVLVSIIIGLGVTHILKNIVFLIQYKDVKFYWIHTLWCANIFFMLIFFWWWQYNYVVIDQWSFGLYLFITFFALIYYLLASLLFSGRDIKSYKEHFYSNRKWFFNLLALSILIDYGDTALKGFDYFIDRGLSYHLAVITFTLMSLIGARTKKEKYHAIFAITNLSYQIIDGFLIFNLIQS